MGLLDLVDDYVGLQRRGKPRRDRPIRERSEADDRLLKGDALDPNGPSGTNWLRELVKWVPQEAIAVYLLALPYLVARSPHHYTSRWALTGSVAVLSALFVFGNYRQAVRKERLAMRPPWGRMIVASIAFIGWVYTIPASPFGSFGFYDLQQGPIVAGLLTMLIVLLNQITGWLDPA